MKRFALPLIILGVTVLLLLLIALGGSSSADYSIGKATEQPLSAEWVKGNQASGVVLIEYSDFQCPACAAYEPLIRQVEAAYGTRAAFVYRHFPLVKIHTNADLAARASEAAGKQGKFWEMHDAIFDNHDAWEKQVNAQAFFETYAKQIGLDVAQFTKDLTADDVKQAVADDYARGQLGGVQGTPTFFLNGKQISPGSYDEFAAALDAAIAGK